MAQGMVMRVVTDCGQAGLADGNAQSLYAMPKPHLLPLADTGCPN